MSKFVVNKNILASLYRHPCLYDNRHATQRLTTTGHQGSISPNFERQAKSRQRIAFGKKLALQF